MHVHIRQDYAMMDPKSSQKVYTYLKLPSHTLKSLQCTPFASVMSFELGGLKYEDLQTHLKPV